MALLDQSSLDPAENWGMVEMKESVLTYSLLALGMETKKKKNECLRNKFPILCAFFFLSLLFSSLATLLSCGSFTCFRYHESSLEELYSLKFPGPSLQLIMWLVSFTFDLYVVHFISSFVILD